MKRLDDSPDATRRAQELVNRGLDLIHRNDAMLSLMIPPRRQAHPAPAPPIAVPVPHSHRAARQRARRVSRSTTKAGDSGDDSEGDAPADRLLMALRATRPDAYRADPERLGRWVAYCPACGPGVNNARRLEISEPGAGGAVRFRCRTGCDRDAILAALELAEELYDTAPLLTPWGFEVPSLALPFIDAALASLREAQALIRELGRESRL